MTSIVLILAFASISLIWMIAESFADDFTLTHGFIGLFMISIIFLCINILIDSVSTNKDGPDAIDVYRGRTTLEITYRDSIAIDTVIVFK